MLLRKNRVVLLVCLLTVALLSVALLAGCGGAAKKTTPNTVSTFFYDGSRFEATVRELSVSSRSAEARVRIINVGGYSVDKLAAEALFIDGSGQVLYTVPIDESDSPMLAGDSISVTVSCSGKNAGKVTHVNVSSAE